MPWRIAARAVIPVPALSGVKRNSGNENTNSQTALIGAEIRSCSWLDTSSPNKTLSGSQPQSMIGWAGRANAYNMATKMISVPPLPRLSASPDKLPSRLYGTIEGNIALWKTSVNAKPVPAIARAIATVTTPRISWPGTAYQRRRIAGIIMITDAAIHGLRRPTLSAIAPRNGARLAVIRPAKPVI